MSYKPLIESLNILQNETIRLHNKQQQYLLSLMNVDVAFDRDLIEKEIAKINKLSKLYRDIQEEYES